MKKQKQHYYPRFALNRWLGKDHKLQPYGWTDEVNDGPVLRRSRTSSKSVCREIDLYTLETINPGNPFLFEEEFFGPLVDEPAALALQSFESGSVRDLTPHQRFAWAAFLVSLPARTPEALSQMTTGFYAGLDTDASEYEAAKADEDPPTLSEWARKHEPGYVEDMARKLMVDVIVDADAKRSVEEMIWWTSNTHPHQLVVSDRPLLSSTGQEDLPCAFNADDPRQLIALPISPFRVFFASHDKRVRTRVRRKPRKTLAAQINHSTLSSAVSHVMALNTDIEPFILSKWKKLRKA